MIRYVVGLFALFVVCNAKMPVTIYYEALCPDSQAFITQQVYPQMKAGLSDLVDITWIPYGKASRETQGADVMFKCHHGPDECYGNKVQACALQHIQVNSYQNSHTRDTLILEYINCLMKMGNNFADNVYPGQRCASDNRLENWQVIQQCANSTEGSKLLEKMGKITDTLENPLSSVPFVTFEYTADKELQPQALSNFRSVVCKKLASPQRPPICADISGATGLIMAPVTILTAFAMSRMF